MTSRHRVDVSTRFARDEPGPETQEIEVPDDLADPISNHHPRTERIRREPYLVGPDLEQAVNLAIALGRPLLLQGDPGSGKTRLAYAVAFALGLPLEECYIKSTSQAQDLLYTYDAVRRLYDAQFRPGDSHEQGRSNDVRHYIRLGPLGRAIARGASGRRSVVLIDEIDKADIDFPNDLLRELDRLEFEIPDAPGLSWILPDDRPDLRPIIFVTNNEEKALPAAFLRRCIFHYVQFPDDREYLGEILALHDVRDAQLRHEAIEILLRLRELDLSKKPGLSELLDWVGYLQTIHIPVEELRNLPYIGALLKQYADQQRAIEEVRVR